MHVPHAPNSTQTWHTAGIPYGVNKLLIETFTEAALEKGKGKASTRRLQPQAQRQAEARKTGWTNLFDIKRRARKTILAESYYLYWRPE